MKSQRNAWELHDLTPRAWVHSTSEARVSLDPDEHWNRVRVIVEQRRRPGRPFRKVREKVCPRDLETIMGTVPAPFRGMVARFLAHAKRARVEAGEPETALAVELPDLSVWDLTAALAKEGLLETPRDASAGDDGAIDGALDVAAPDLGVRDLVALAREGRWKSPFATSAGDECAINEARADDAGEGDAPEIDDTMLIVLDALLDRGALDDDGGDVSVDDVDALFARLLAEDADGRGGGA
jgi:hypothetical protein